MKSQKKASHTKVWEAVFISINKALPLLIRLVSEQGADKLRTAADIIFWKNISYVSFNSAFADEQRSGNFAVGPAGKDKL